MEYLALVYGDPDSWETMSESDRATAYEGYMAVARDAEAAGALVDAAELESTAAATSVRVRGGEAVVNDGPYAEVKESLGGYRHFHSARADLLRRLGRARESRDAYCRALALTESGSERRFLERQLGHPEGFEE